MNYLFLNNNSYTNIKNIGAKKLNKDIFVGVPSITGSRIILTNNEVKGIMKVIKSLRNRGILLKETTRKITRPFLRPLMTAGLPLMKSVFTPLAKSVLLPFIISSNVSNRCSYSKENLWISSSSFGLSFASFGLSFVYNSINNFG